MKNVGWKNLGWNIAVNAVRLAACGLFVWYIFSHVNPIIQENVLRAMNYQGLTQEAKAAVAVGFVQKISFTVLGMSLLSIVMLTYGWILPRWTPSQVNKNEDNQEVVK